MNYWLAIGPTDNWEIGIKKQTWAVSPRHAKTWGRVQPGDTIFFYAMQPIKGLVGLGTVEETKVDQKPFWPQEVSENQRYWPVRIVLKETRTLPRKNWESHRIPTGREGIVFQRALQAVDEKRAQKWERALSDASRTQ